MSAKGRQRGGRSLPRPQPKGKSTRRRNRGASKATGRNGASGQFGTSLNNVGFTVRSLPLFPYRTRRNLPYYFSGQSATGTATNNAYVISANGAFDPDISGTGGQPMGFDQMMTFYNHYTVIRSRIRVLLANTSTTIMPTVALSVSGSSSVTSSYEQLMENGDLATAWLGYAGSRGGDCRLTRAVTAARFQGIDDVLDDPNMRGDNASNPAEQLYYHINMFNFTNATQVSVNFQGLVEYDIMFHEPKKASLSISRRSPLEEKGESLGRPLNGISEDFVNLKVGRSYTLCPTS